MPPDQPVRTKTVTAIWPLNLYHLSAKICQQLGAVRTGYMMAQVEHFDIC